MLCDDIKTKLQDYLDGDLSHKFRKDVAEHLKTCVTCQQEYRELQQLRELAKQEILPIPAAEDKYWSVAWQKIERKIKDQPQGIGVFERVWEVLRPQFQVARVAYTAAVFVVGILFGGYAFRAASPPEIISVRVNPQPNVQARPVLEGQKVSIPKVVERTKYRYVVVEPTTAVMQPAEPAVVATTAGTESESPDVISRHQIQQFQQELQKDFDEHDVSKQIAQILGQT